MSKEEINLPFAECPIPNDTRKREYGCGCMAHDFSLDTGPHLHYCRVHAVAFELLKALKVCQVRVFLADGYSAEYQQAEDALTKALGPRNG